MTHVTRLLLAGALLATAACAAPAGEGTTTPAPAAAEPTAARQTTPRRNPDLISEEEIRARPELRNAYDLVQSLRPQWLRTRGTSTAGYANVPTIQAYLDSQRLGNASQLRNVESTAIKEIRYLDSMAASSRFGSDNTAGAIQVVSNRGG
ncbi:MAG TPA: hypothetical protein VFQ45_03435 [Longimicrobium sp.]|nr:hypothetical protein [Longimicrobium sp.]